MAKVYLDANDTFTVSNNGVTVYGNTGGTGEVVSIGAGVTGTVFDASVERVTLTGAVSDYTYKQTGNIITVYSGTTAVATQTVNETAGTKLTFSNGTAVAAIGTGGVMTLGGKTVTTTAAAVVPTTIDATVVTPTVGPTFSIAADKTSNTEGGTASFTVTLSAAQSTATTVNFAIAGTGGATLGTDTGAVTVTGATAGTISSTTPTGTLTFPAGVVSAKINLPVSFDSLTETGEGATVTLSSASTGTITTASASTSFADPAAPTFTLTSNAVAGAANEEGSTITYTITPSSITDKAYSLTLSTQGDTVGGVAALASAADFSPASQTVTFAAGATAAQTVVQTIVNDGVIEGLEGYKTSLLDSTFTSIASKTGLITDPTSGTGSGTTYTLTTGQDTFTGTSGNDTFVADATTLSASDTVDGAAGTGDVFSYTDGSTGGTAPASALVSNVETINIRNVNSATGTVKEVFNATFSITATGTDTIKFDGVTVTLADGDVPSVAAGKVATATFTNWTATVGSATGMVTFTYKTGQEVTDQTASNFTIVDAGGAGAPTVSVATPTTQGYLGAADAVVASNYTGANAFNANLSTSPVNFSSLPSGSTVGVIGNGSLTTSNVTAGYVSGATAGTFNVSGGTSGGTLTETGSGITSTTINSTGTSNSQTAVVLPSNATNLLLTINATTNFSAGTGITGFGGTTAKITATGAATTVTLGTLENTTVATVDASGLSAGGVTFTANTNPALVFTGGQGNDTVTLGATALTTGSIAAGAGTGDRLTVTDATAVADATKGGKISGFEVLGVQSSITVDMDNLAANNTFTSLRIGTGTNVVNNVNTTAGSAVTIITSTTPTISIKGATTPGQVDTMALTVSDGSSTVNTITITAPTVAGLETLNITATDNTTITTLANAPALTAIGVAGAGNVIITTSAMALQTNFAVNAGTATGNLTLNGSGETTNGFSVTGSAGINTITGGMQIFSANLSASTAKADVLTITSATGGSLVLPNATITGFTNSATVAIGDKLDVAGTVTVGKAGATVVAAATATVATMTGALSAGGIMTFAGTGAATATLADRINATFEGAYIGGTAMYTAAFEYSGDTYVCTETAGNNAFDAATDFIAVLKGVTGVTALSTGASAATTVWVI